MRWVLFAFTVPWSIPVGWGWVVLMCLLWAADWRTLRWEPTAVLTTEWRPWTARFWSYSTTLGRGIIYQPHAVDDTAVPSTRIERHEHVHVRQVEDLMVLSFIVGAFVYYLHRDALLAYWVWTSGGMWQLPNFLTAAMRHGIRNSYRDAEHERSSYAQTDLIRRLGKGWDQIRDAQRK